MLHARSHGFVQYYGVFRTPVHVRRQSTAAPVDSFGTPTPMVELDPNADTESR